MIERLLIKNYAIIDQLELELGQGFYAFTGETGAGKSIIIGALGLLLGEKGDSSMVRTGEERAIIEAEFSVSHPQLKDKLKAIEIDAQDSIIVRRELSTTGKNRVFINGLQEPLAKLEELGEWLVDIHGQHDHQLLLQQKVHLDILDSYGKLNAEKETLAQGFAVFQRLLEELGELKQDEAKLQEEKTFWETAVVELEGAGLYAGEEEELAESLKRMENAEKINRSFDAAYTLLYEDDNAVSDKLGRATMELKELAGYDQRYEELLSILEDAQAKVDECSHLVHSYRGELEFDSNTMEETIERLSTIRDCKRKYHKNSVQELIEYAATCKERLDRFENRAEEVEKLEKQIAEQKQVLLEAAMALSKKRQETAKSLAARVKSELAFLGMERAEFLADIKYVKDEASPFSFNSTPVKLTASGIDRVEFFISSNPGEEPRPLKKVASGGEISRVMLALKAIFAESDSVESMVFDEIDTGIGGLTANNVGVKMREIAEKRQLLVITHLPQIASRASKHLLIMKETDGSRTFTRLTELKGEARVEEIARMLGGESAASRNHAQEMLLEAEK